MLEQVWENPWVRAVLLVIAAVLSCILCYLLAPVLVPLFFAFLVAYVLDPVVDVFEKRNISRALAVSGLAVFALILFLGVPIVFIPAMFQQADELLSGGSRADGEAWSLNVIDKPLAKVVETFDLDEIAKNRGYVKEDETDLAPREILAKLVGGYAKDYGKDMLGAYGGRFASAGKFAGTTLGQLFSSMGRGVLGVIMFLANFALFAFVAGYLLKDYDSIIASTREMVPPRYREKLFSIMGKIDCQIRNFLQGQMIVCLCLGGMYAVGLLIAGVPFALLLAAFGAVASFVPYLGLSLTILPAISLTLLRHGLDWHVLFVIGTFMVAQILEGTVITPKVVGDKVGLNPVWVILAVLVFGNALGFLGLLLAVPIAASLKVLVVEGVAYYKGSTVFESADS